MEEIHLPVLWCQICVTPEPQILVFNLKMLLHLSTWVFSMKIREFFKIVKNMPESVFNSVVY